METVVLAKIVALATLLGLVSGSGNHFKDGDKVTLTFP